MMRILYDLTVAHGDDRTYASLVHNLTIVDISKDDYNQALDTLWKRKEAICRELLDQTLDCTKGVLIDQVMNTYKVHELEDEFNLLSSNAEFLSNFYHYVVLPAKGLSPTADRDPDY